MKYLLDAVLVIGLLWLAQVWNGERKNGIALEEQLEIAKAKATSLEKDLAEAKAGAEKVAAELGEAKGVLEATGAELKATAEQLADKAKEADQLKEVGLRLKARVDELEGYKKKAIVAEMPQPAK